MKRDEVVFLEDVLNELLKIEKSVENINEEEFVKNLAVKDAT